MGETYNLNVLIKSNQFMKLTFNLKQNLFREQQGYN